jgi:hypothetical protein
MVPGRDGIDGGLTPTEPIERGVNSVIVDLAETEGLAEAGVYRLIFHETEFRQESAVGARSYQNSEASHLAKRRKDVGRNIVREFQA